MAHGELVAIAEKIVWDYDHAPEEIAEVLAGERERVGHFDRSALFLRMLQSLPWQRIVQTLGMDEVRLLLTPEVIERLWPPSLRERYVRIRSVLQGNPVPATEWSSERARALRDTFLADRWNRPP